MSHKFYKLNELGRDFVIGDLHGEYDKLCVELEKVSFEIETDRLFSVGDIIDRGPNSLECLKLIREPWFNTVLGNHEEMMINSIVYGYDPSMWLENGGMWVADALPDTVWELCNEIRELSLAITIETKNGGIGICHAQPPTRNWMDIDHLTIHERNVILWSRSMARIGGHAASQTRIENIDKVYCGHCVMPEVTEMGNITFLDTGCGFQNGKLSMVEIR